ncbi:hypothetical protein [Jeotgalibacillus aurantiacus]|uniref:hypothetical protein n=1 Tax=Jeotgalibacillus aurantiacus TaxID=2763266 RepID=UPI001D0A9AA3|nr:hypothetical protein [Jeotgalibacillus aurantiacus]
MKDRFYLNDQRFPEARETIMHILWMYHDMARSYGGFGHNIDFEPVDYEKFLFATVMSEKDEVIYGKEAELLHQGSIIALGCEVVNLLDEEQRNPKIYDFIDQTLNMPELDHHKNDQAFLQAMKDAFDEETDAAWERLPKGAILNQHLKDVYEKYVLGYYLNRVNEVRLR